MCRCGWSCACRWSAEPPGWKPGNEQFGGNHCSKPVRRAAARTAQPDHPAPDVRRCGRSRAAHRCPAATCSEETTLRCSSAPPISEHKVRPSAATTESSLTGVVANVAWRIASMCAGAAGIDAARGQRVERRDGFCDPAFGQRDAAPGREVQLLLALPLNQIVQPKVERRHRRRPQAPRRQRSPGAIFVLAALKPSRNKPVKLPTAVKAGLSLSAGKPAATA